jgi:hypothetical protein
MSLSKIFEGWKNHLAPDAFYLEQITKASTERLAICSQCPHYSINDPNRNPFRPDIHCTNCGCTLSAKTKCLSCECPLKKWSAIISSEEEQIIEKNGKV